MRSVGHAARGCGILETLLVCRPGVVRRLVEGLIMAQAKTIDPITLADALTGRAPVAAFVAGLATDRVVAYIPVVADALAGAISRLSDAEHAPDSTEDHLVALARAGVITEGERFALHAAYLRQKAE